MNPDQLARGDDAEQRLVELLQSYGHSAIERRPYTVSDAGQTAPAYALDDHGIRHVQPDVRSYGDNCTEWIFQVKSRNAPLRSEGCECYGINRSTWKALNYYHRKSMGNVFFVEYARPMDTFLCIDAEYARDVGWWFYEDGRAEDYLCVPVHEFLPLVDVLREASFSDPLEAAIYRFPHLAAKHLIPRLYQSMRADQERGQLIR